MRDKPVVTKAVISVGLATLAGCGSHALAPQIPPVLSSQSLAQSVSHKHQVRYRLIDMGTFGGPSSQGTQVALSGRTIAVGWSATAIPKLPHSHPLICGGSDGIIQFITRAFEWENGVVHNLGALPGADNCSAPQSLNAHGIVVGLSENGAFDPQTGFNKARAVLWRAGHIEDLGSLGGNQAAAIAINNRDQIVGNSENTIPDPYDFFGLPNQLRAFLWQNGRMVDIGTLGTGKDAAAQLINDRGQIAGTSNTNSIQNPVTNFPTVDPFLWENGKMIDLGTLGGTNGSPNALNNRGHVVGQSNVSGDLSSHPFFWDGHRMIDIGTAGGNFGNAWALNEADEVVGSTTTSGDAAWRAFVWKHGVRTDLPTLPGACGSLAWGIDSRRRVVGNAIGCGFNAIPAGEVVMWDHGTIVDLNDLVPSDAPLHLTQVGPISQAGPFVINDRGEIAGIGTPTGVPTEQSIFKGHAFLLIPCEEDEARCDGSVRKQ